MCFLLRCSSWLGCGQSSSSVSSGRQPGKPWINKCIDRVIDIAYETFKMLAYAFITGACLWINSPFFLTFGVIGIGFGPRVREVIDRIIITVQEEVFSILGIAALGAFVAPLPSALIIMISLWGAHLGSELQQTAQKKKDSTTPENLIS